ncbi:MAG: uncharacterized protein A8A55_2969 [Amphiamblys sp. WSBS2006]|nr:MAG: uncharacterized protein A8A55_2969 [Amphiamblys sp. WSBS2006]
MHISAVSSPQCASSQAEQRPSSFFCFSRYLPRGVLHGERDGVCLVKTLEQGPSVFDLGFSQNRGMMSEDTEYASPECLLASVNPLGQLRDLLIFSVFEVSPRGVH